MKRIGTPVFNDEAIETFLSTNDFYLTSEMNGVDVYQTDEGEISFFHTHYQRTYDLNQGEPFYWGVRFSAGYNAREEIINRMIQYLKQEDKGDFLLINEAGSLSFHPLNKSGLYMLTLFRELEESGLNLSLSRESFLLKATYGSSHVFDPIYPEGTWIGFLHDSFANLNRDTLPAFMTRLEKEKKHLEDVQKRSLHLIREADEEASYDEFTHMLRALGKRIKWRFEVEGDTFTCRFQGKTTSKDPQVFQEKVEKKIRDFIQKNRLPFITS